MIGKRLVHTPAHRILGVRQCRNVTSPAPAYLTKQNVLTVVPTTTENKSSHWKASLLTLPGEIHVQIMDELFGNAIRIEDRGRCHGVPLASILFTCKTLYAKCRQYFFWKYLFRVEEFGAMRYWQILGGMGVRCDFGWRQ